MKNKLLKFLALAFTCLSISAVATACGGTENGSSSSEALSSSVEDSGSSSSDSSSSSSEDLSSGVEDSSSSSSDGSSSEDNTPANMYPEESLQFQKIAGKEEYRVVGLGNVSDLEIVIPSTYRGLPVTEIGECAFRSTEDRKATANITSVVIPDSVTSIRYEAFCNCYGLTSIEIPDSVTSIDYSAFSRCDSLIIYCEAEGQPDAWDDGWNSYECLVVWDCKNNDVATDGYIYTTVDGIRYAVKDGLAIVARQSENITVANIASSITYKGANYTVASIGNSAFSDCYNLTSVVIPNSVTSIGNSAFSNCDRLTSIEIPDSVTSIGYRAFEYCRSLTSIEIPNSVTSIGDSAFYGCSSLTSVVIPDSVTSIGNSAFSDCYNLQYTIKDNLKYLGNATNPYLYLAGTTSSDITSANIDDNCKIIGYSAFSCCHSLTSVEIPNSVTSIGDYAFYSCYALTRIVIPDSVMSIGYWAFSGCESLTIYCEAEKQPSGWDEYWNCYCPVVWGYKGE